MQTNDLYKIELLVLDNNTWNYLTVCKQTSSAQLKMSCTNSSLTIYIYIYIGFGV